MTVLAATKGAFTTAGELGLHRISGLGFRPVATIAWWARLSDSGVERGNRGGIGFWTEGGEGSVAWSSEDDVESTRVARIADAAALLGLDEAGADVDLKATVQSFDEDGITLRYTKHPSRTWLVHFLALGGESLRGARVGWYSPLTHGSTRSKALDTEFVLLVPSPAEQAAVISRELAVGFGARDGESGAIAGYVCADDTQPGAVSGMQRTGVASFERDTTPRFLYLQLGGARVRIGTGQSRAKRGSQRTRVPFRPDALILFSWGFPPSRDARSIGRLCIGAAAAGDSGCISWDDRNFRARRTRTHVRSSMEHVLVITDTRTGGIHAMASLSPVDDRGFTLDWIDDRGGREFVYVALGEPATPRKITHLVDRVTRVMRAGQQP